MARAAQARGRPRRRSLLGRMLAAAALLILALLVLAILVAVVQGRRDPVGEPRYVALGSSFAAGAGLGPLQKSSPLLCARSVGGYPPRLARLLDIPLVDMTCGGAVTRHLYLGGQAFQGPQVRAVARETELVTITVGGNDVGYVGDLGLLAARHDRTVFGWLVRRLWRGPKPAEGRDYAEVRADLNATATAVRARSPTARIVFVTYPTIVPPEGSCGRIGLTPDEAGLMRDVGDRLAQATRQAAADAGAVLIDLNAEGRDHNACSRTPWVTAWSNGGPAPFHPTALGAQATAARVASVLEGMT